eukprot:50175-Hanusia_phi.AAC.1
MGPSEVRFMIGLAGPAANAGYGTVPSVSQLSWQRLGLSELGMSATVTLRLGDPLRLRTVGTPGPAQ